MWPNQWLVCIIGIKPELLLSCSPHDLTNFNPKGLWVQNVTVTPFLFSEVRFFSEGAKLSTF